MFSVFCKYLLNDATYGKRHLITKHSPLNYASIGTILETIGATVESVEQFEVKSFFETRNNCLCLLQISPKRRILRKKGSITKYSPFKYASIGTIPEMIGATVESVEQFEVSHFLIHEISFSVFCKYFLNDASYGKRHPFTKYSPLKYASIGTSPETISATVESVEQFEVKSFFETRNNFLSFCKYLLNDASYRKGTPLRNIRH